MSNLELLTVEETATAASQGWSCAHVYDLNTKAWRVMVLGMPSSADATQLVINHAKMGSALHQKALKFVMASQGK